VHEHRRGLAMSEQRSPALQSLGRVTTVESSKKVAFGLSKPASHNWPLHLDSSELNRLSDQRK
jgi:hypothetical protein